MPNEPRYNLKKIIIIGVILIIIAIIIGILFLRQSSNQNNSTQGKNLFPYGTTSTGGTTGSTNSTGQQGTVPTEQSALQLAGADRLRELANYPVTDYFVSSEVQSSATDPLDLVRWNAKQTGLIMDAEVNSTIIVETQKTKTTVPDAEEFWLGNSGNSVIYRTWNAVNRSIDSLIGSITPSQLPAYCTTTFGANLKQGTKNSDVKALQVYVNQKLHLGLNMDGVYGSGLVKAIKALQKSMQLKQTGVFDDATRGAVNDDCSTIITAYNAQKTTPQNLNNIGFLTTNILRGSVSPDGTKIFLLESTPTGVSGVIANSDGTGQKTIWSSPLTEWRPQWVNATTIAMTTLASREAMGYLYFLNTTTGNFQKILGPARGLTTLVSPDANTVMVSQSTDSRITTGFYNVTTGVYKNSDLVTLPEKCFWSSNTVVTCGIPQTISSGVYPDDWYQGTQLFADNLWSIDTSSGATTDILNPTQLFDMIHIRTSPDGHYAYFINKTDGTLWSYRLK